MVTSSSSTTLSLLFILCTSLVLSSSSSTTVRLSRPSTRATKQCRPGSYLNAATSSCQLCGPGTYSWGGTFRSCSKCPRNTYTPYTGVVDETLCLPCPSGMTSPSGSSTCYKQHNRSSKSSSRSPTLPPRTRCGRFNIPPPEGVSYFSDSVCVSPVDGCPRGMKLFKWARKAICKSKKTGLVRCQNNAVYDGVDRCLSCSTGMKLVRVENAGKFGIRKFKCERCDGNSVSKGGLQMKCSTCRCGYARNSNGSSCKRTVPKGQSITC